MTRCAAIANSSPPSRISSCIPTLLVLLNLTMMRLLVMWSPFGGNMCSPMAKPSLLSVQKENGEGFELTFDEIWSKSLPCVVRFIAIHVFGRLSVSMCVVDTTS